MDNLGWYILASAGCLGGFLLIYRWLFSKMTHFGINRGILLASIGLSLLLPVAALQTDLISFPTQEFELSKLPKALTPLPLEKAVDQGSPEIPFHAETPQNVKEELSTPLLTPTRKSVFPWETLIAYGKYALWGVYFLGLGITLFGSLKGIFHVVRLIRKSQKVHQDGITLVYPSLLKGSFSFFTYLFLSPEDRNSSNRTVVEAHESVHIQQLHSLDVLLAELACSFWWFIPWRKYLRDSLKETHEFLADEQAATQYGKVAYSRLVLAQVNTPTSSLPVHFFAQSKTKKRIIMLNRTPSPGTSRLKYLGLLPVIILSFGLLACIPAPPEEAASPEFSIDSETLSTITFAGETLPMDAVYQQGLTKRIDKLKANPTYCRRIYLRAVNGRKTLVPQLAAEGIPTDFFYLAVAESGLDPNAASSMGACGVWQFMPATAKSYGMVIEGDRDDRKNTGIATQSAIQYLKNQHKTFNSWLASALAYNRGPKALRDFNPDYIPEKWLELDHERGYIYRILAFKQLVENPSEFEISGTPQFQLPFQADATVEVSSHFGPRKSPFDQKLKNHSGIDFKTAMGTLVVAIEDGQVEVAEVSDKKIGNHIKISHGAPLSSNYHHLQEVRVKPGQQVKRGEVIGTVGSTGLSTGPHLHLEILEKGIPVDPTLYITP